MAAGSLIKKFCEETTCSVCLESFKEPVTIECGHNFCQACLTQCWAKSNTGPACPQCQEIFQQKNFRPNRQLANLVELIRELQVGKGAKGKWGGCERHQEPLKLFCVSDQAPICVVCDRSMGHQNHRVLPMEEAFLEYKKEIQAELQSLEQERRKLQEQIMAEDQRSQKFWTQLQVEKKKTKSAFQQLHSYLEKEEHFGLSQLEEIEKEMAKRDKDNHARFLKEVSYLSRLIKEMEKKFQQSEKAFLRDPKTILSRESLKHTLEEALHKVNVTLDVKTAHPQLILSPDMKSVTWGSVRENLPDNPERFDTLLSVLGCEKFTSGRHYWEVEVGNGQAVWAVGVARESVKRKGDITLNPDEGFWILQKKWYVNSRNCALLDVFGLTSSQSLPLSTRIPRKILVSLDYEEGCVEFFSAETNQRLFAFPSTSFSGEALRPYFWLGLQGSLKCCS